MRRFNKEASLLVGLPDQHAHVIGLMYPLVAARLDQQKHKTSLTELASDSALIETLSPFVSAMSIEAFPRRSQVLFAFICVCYQLYFFRAAGERSYEVAKGLALQLKDTELRGLVSEDLRLPYPSVFIAAPSGLGLELWGAPGSPPRPFEGVFITEDSSGLPSDLPYRMQSEDGRTGYLAPTGGHRAWRMLLIGSNIREPQAVGGVTFSMVVELFPDRTLDDDIKLTLDFHEMPEGMAGRWESIFRWALNVMIYATWPDAEREHVMMNAAARSLWNRIQKLPKNSQKRERLKIELRSIDPQRRVLLGSHVIYVDRAAAQESGHGGSGKKLELRVRVSGHWRRQPCGPKSSLRKLMWIQPFWRGPEDGALSQAVHFLKHRYMLQQPTTLALAHFPFKSKKNLLN